MSAPDYVFERHGSLWLVEPQTSEARQHLQAHVSGEAQWYHGALVVEPRYVDALAVALEDDGFSTEVLQ